MTTAPSVSVVMPVYNGAAFLREAIESVLAQTFRDFELLLINDGSTDDTQEIIDSYRRDSRLRCISRPNKGLIATLNEGWQRARGSYIARMDADDVSAPERLARQVAFLDAHLDVGVVGSAIWVIDAHGQRDGPIYLPATHHMIVWRLCFEDPLVHPTVLIRRAVLERAGGYDPAMPHAEDYDLWRRVSAFTRLHNLPDVLLSLRKHATNVSQVHRAAQGENSTRIGQAMIGGLLGRTVPLALVQQLEHHRYASAVEALDVVELIEQLFAICRSYPDVTRNERRYIADDAATRLLRVAIRCPGDREIQRRLARFGLRHPGAMSHAVIEGWRLRRQQGKESGIRIPVS